MIECVREPLVAVIVIVKVPGTAFAATLSVSVDVVVVGLGLKLAVTPEGKPDALRVTEPVNPFSGVIVMVDVPEAPRLMVRVEGLAERLKSGGGGLVTVSV